VAIPDRLADNIAAIIINDIQKKDGPKSHAAIEVFITHDTVIIAGEATTSLELTKQYLAQVVERAYELSGYLPEMRQYWKKEEVMLAKDMKIINKVSPQSIDIALGTTDKGEDTGWNDQGIMLSSSENTNDVRIGTPMLVAVMIGEYLQKYSRESILAERADFRIGPDNKCIVTCDVEEDGFTPKCISAITIAVPHHAEADTEKFNSYIKELVLNYLNEQAPVIKCTVSPDCKWVINGTGRFVCHGNVADTSMCLAEGTLVTANKGFRKIEDLQVGETVYTPKGKARVVETFDNGVKPVIVVMDSRGTVLKATHNHPFRVWNGENFEWRRADELKVGDTLVKSQLKGVCDTFNGPKVINFTWGHSNNKSSIVIDNRLAYLLGWLSGDGNTTEDDRITFYVNPDSSEKQMLKQKLINVFGGGLVKDYAAASDRFIICSTSLRDELLKLGVLKESARHKTVPSIVLENTDAFRASYLRGLFDSDGTMNGRNPVLTSSSELLLQQVQTMLSFRSIQSHIRRDISEGHEKYDGSWIRETDRHDLIVGGTRSIETFRRFIGFDVDYKAEKLERVDLTKCYEDNRSFFVASILNRLLKKDMYRVARYGLEKDCDLQAVNRGRKISSERLSYILDLYEGYSDEDDYKMLRDLVDNYTFTTIESLGADEAHTYDISLDDESHAFLANGVVVHNTGRKISVNHPSAGPLWCNKMIGGGSLVKPFHASDLILNVTARFIANVLVRAGLTKYAVVGVACSIGKKEIQSMFIHGDESFEKNVNRKDAITAYFHQNFDWTPIALATKFGFFSEGFDFGRIVNDNFFGKQNQPWDNDELILKEAQALNLALGALMKE